MILQAQAAGVGTALLLVLDTNVVLDWLVFRDLRCAELGDALRHRRARWIATEAMRQELQCVLARGTLDAWAPDLLSIWSNWEQWAQIVAPPPAPIPRSPRCTDPDDQKFIDLGLHVGAHALLSRDRAVLRCARRTRPLGLDILPPDAWVAR